MQSESGDSFIWPYRDTNKVGPLGNGVKELREIERLANAVRDSEVAIAQTNQLKRHKMATGSMIVTDTLVNLKDNR